GRTPSFPLHSAKLLFWHAWHENGNDRDTTPDNITTRSDVCLRLSPFTRRGSERTSTATWWIGATRCARVWQGQRLWRADCGGRCRCGHSSDRPSRDRQAGAHGQRGRRHPDGARRIARHTAAVVWHTPRRPALDATPAVAPAAGLFLLACQTCLRR